MCHNDIDGFELRGIEKEDVARGGRDVNSAWRSMRRSGELSWECLLGKRIGKVAVLGG